MSFLRRDAAPHIWEMKNFDIEQLKNSIEGRESCYQDKEFKKIAKRYKKYEKRGVSKLYLLKEMDDEGVVSALYAFSIESAEIEKNLLMSMRHAASEHLSTGELRADAYAKDPDEWWEKDPEPMIKRVENRNPEGFLDLLASEVTKVGVYFTDRQVRKRSKASELECSAVVWGVKESGFRKGVWTRVIQNTYL